MMACVVLGAGVFAGEGPKSVKPAVRHIDRLFLGSAPPPVPDLIKALDELDANIAKALKDEKQDLAAATTRTPPAASGGSLGPISEPDKPTAEERGPPARCR